MVEGAEAEDEAGGHGLGVVELGVGWPAGVVDVGLVPVGYVAACGGGDGDEGDEGAAGGWHVVWRGE